MKDGVISDIERRLLDRLMKMNNIFEEQAEEIENVKQLNTKIMTIDEIEDALDNALDEIDGISYSIDSEEEQQGLCFEIEFDYDDFDDADEDWDKQVEDAVSDVISEYGGSFEWDDNIIIYTIPLN